MEDGGYEEFMEIIQGEFGCDTVESRNTSNESTTFKQSWVGNVSGHGVTSLVE